MRRRLCSHRAGFRYGQPATEPSAGVVGRLDVAAGVSGAVCERDRARAWRWRADDRDDDDPASIPAAPAPGALVGVTLPNTAAGVAELLHNLPPKIAGRERLERPATTAANYYSVSYAELNGTNGTLPLTITIWQVSDASGATASAGVDIARNCGWRARTTASGAPGAQTRSSGSTSPAEVTGWRGLTARARGSSRSPRPPGTNSVQRC